MKRLKKLIPLVTVFVWSHTDLLSQNFIDKYLSDPLTYSVIGNASNNVNKPRDLDFKPHTNELWVVNYGTNQGGSVVVFYEAGQVNQTSQYRKDSHTGHFMIYPSALAFSSNGEWASTNEIKSTGSPNSTFMGPSLWSGDTSITARVFQNNWVNGYPLGSHLDMLHQSPFAMGVAADTLKAYWVYDGYNSNLCKYDFNVDHSPGYDDHSAGKIWRYSDVSVQRAPGIPSHMVLDKASGWLYFVDAGNKQVRRINTSTGTIAGNLTAPNEALALYQNVTGVTQQTVDTYTTQPCGIDYFDNRLIVSDNMTGDIRIYNTAPATPTLMGTISTGQPGIMGVKIGADGKIWFVNYTQNTVVRIDPLPALNDAAVAEIIYPTTENTEKNFYSPVFNNCSGSVAPVIRLKNTGSANLTSAVINYKIDNGSAVSYTWNGNLSAGSSATVNLPSFSPSDGEHKILVYAEMPNNSTDQNPLNDKKAGSFRSKAMVMSLPFQEDFSAAAFPPVGWSSIGYNKFCFMSRNALVGGFGLSAGALKMNNFSGADNITGQKDYFLSPRIDVTTASEITYLTFDVAYARRNAASTDALEVSISSDCGNSWTSLYQKSGSSLSTAGDVGSAFSPAPEEWRTDSIDLSGYADQPEVMLLFTTNSNWGNNLYLDNINIRTWSTVGLQKQDVNANVYVFPNPTTGKVTIKTGDPGDLVEELQVRNIMGQEILTNGIPYRGDAMTELDFSGHAAGTYFVSLKVNGSLVVKKIVLSTN